MRAPPPRPPPAIARPIPASGDAPRPPPGTWRAGHAARVASPSDMILSRYLTGNRLGDFSVDPAPRSTTRPAARAFRGDSARLGQIRRTRSSDAPLILGPRRPCPRAVFRQVRCGVLIQRSASHRHRRRSSPSTGGGPGARARFLPRAPARIATGARRGPGRAFLSRAGRFIARRCEKDRPAEAAAAVDDLILVAMFLPAASRGDHGLAGVETPPGGRPRLLPPPLPDSAIGVNQPGYAAAVLCRDRAAGRRPSGCCLDDIGPACPRPAARLGQHLRSLPAPHDVTIGGRRA